MPNQVRLPGFLVPLIGAAAGAGWVGGADALRRLFGGDSLAVVTVGAVAAAAFAVGLCREAFGAADAARGPASRLGIRLAVLGVLVAAGGLAGSASRVLAWAGADAGAGATALTIARVVFSGFLLVPAGLAAGSGLRLAVRFLPEGPGGPRALAVAAAVAVVAAALPVTAAVATPAQTGRGAALAAGALFLLGAAPLLRRRDATPDGAPSPTPLRPAPFLAALAAGFGLAAFAFLGERLLVPSFANDLPGVPLARAVFGLFAAAGATLAAILVAVLAGRAAAPSGPGRFAMLAPMLAGAGAALALVRLADWGALPETFASALGTVSDLEGAVRHALRLVLPRVTPAALLLGAAAAALAGALPSDRPARVAWTALAGTGAAGGAVLGEAWARFAIAPLGLAGTLASAAVAAAVLAAAAVALAPGRVAPRAAVAVALLAAVAAAVRIAPRTDRLALLVDRDLRSPGSLVQGVQKYWLASDQEDDALAAAILRRGHSRRLFVHGRFEASNETTTKTHGMLAHLPLLLHPDPKRVLLLGAGTGGALAAATAHAPDRIDVFDVGRTAVRAAVRMGPTARGAFADRRVHVRTGDLRDLVGRAAPYDVVLLEPSGGWTDRAALASSREFLETVRGRLREDGLACGWVPESALTREGFLVLLGTWARVFPQVEAWAGQGGAVLLLAKRTAAPHDFETLLAAYGKPPVAAACDAAWIGTPDTLLSQFLVGDATIRRLTASSAVHEHDSGELARREAGRRRGDPTVDPVPGLSGIRDDVVAAFVRTPAEGFAAAIARAVRARDLERSGLELELEGKGDEALQAYRDAMALNPRDGAARRAFASLRSRQGIELGSRQAFHGAHAYMREAVDTDTTYAQGLGNLGFLLLQSEDYDYAIACTEGAIALAPDDDLFHLQLGRIWKQRGYYDKALPYYTRARELNPLNLEAAIGWLDTKLAMEGDAADLRWGLAFLEDLRPIDPDHEDLLYRIGKLEDALARRAARAEGAPDAGP